MEKAQSTEFKPGGMCVDAKKVALFLDKRMVGAHLAKEKKLWGVRRAMARDKG